MLLKISVILAVIAVLFLIIYLITARRRTEKGGRKLRRFCGFNAVILIIAAAVTFIIYCKSENIDFFNRTEKYDPVESYTAELKKSGADAAFAGLPDAIFSVGKDIYFKNAKNDMFIIEKQTAEDMTEKTVASTVANGTVFIDGKSTLSAMINDQKELILDGYLLYSEFEGEKIEFNKKIVAKSVVYCALTDNSLLYVTESGDMYALGFNEYGQLGDTTTKNKSSSTYVLPNIKSCSVSETHSMTVDRFGTLCAVGDNSYSQLGNKTAVSSTDPVTIMQGVKDVRVGNYFSVVLALNGELLTAGTNERGQLGNGGAAFKAELIPIMTGVKKVDINGNTCAALTYDGVLYTWGDNTAYKAGYPQYETLYTPFKICENVIDFTLTSDGVALINSDRDILKSNSAGALEAVITFGAVIPEMYKDGADIVQNPTPDAA